MEQIEQNQVVMKEEIYVVDGKVDQIMEVMLELERRKNKPHVVVGARNVTYLFGSTSL